MEFNSKKGKARIVKFRMTKLRELIKLAEQVETLDEDALHRGEHDRIASEIRELVFDILDELL